MEIHRDHPCHPGNYQKGRTQQVKYLVIHYVGALGSAEQNARYYGGTAGIQASAHYFVDHGPAAEVWASVAEGDTAWHCGTTRGYKHPECRNANSVGIEMCCHQQADGTWYFDPETVDAAAELAREIMGRYGIDAARVVRHYDVTGKICPAPFVNDGAAWEAFKGRLTAPASGDTQKPSGEPWYAGDREWVIAQGISDGTRPEKGITRAEVWAMLRRLYNIIMQAVKAGK